MSTLTNLSLREVFETPGSRVVANLLVKEGFAVAEAEGIVIPHDEADHILQKVTVCFTRIPTFHNTPSLLNHEKFDVGHHEITS